MVEMVHCINDYDMEHMFEKIARCISERESDDKIYIGIDSCESFGSLGLTLILAELINSVKNIEVIFTGECVVI